MSVSGASKEAPAYRIYGIMNETFELPEQWTVCDYLGSGAYGCVVAASDGKNTYAIKKCKQIFQSRTLAKRTLREVRILRLIEHPNIISLRKVLMPRYQISYSSLYLVFDCMETDLSCIIRSDQDLTDRHVQYFSVQLFRACEHIHRSSICHRDIKPRNILVNGDCTLKLADFGLSRVLSEANSKNTVPMTEYVTTRWYRSPEVLLGWGSYDEAVDLWAVGCVLCELVARVPVFPGSDSTKQIELILEVLGRPSNEYTNRVRKPWCQELLRSLPSDSYRVRRNIPEALCEKAFALRSRSVSPGPYGVSPEVIRLIDALLVFDPLSRPSASECLESDYFSSCCGSTSKTLESPEGQVPCSKGDTEFMEDKQACDLQGQDEDPVTDIDSSRSISPTLAKTEFKFETSKLTYDMLRMELLREAALYNQNPSSPDAISPPAASSGSASLSPSRIQPEARNDPSEQRDDASGRDVVPLTPRPRYLQCLSSSSPIRIPQRECRVAVTLAGADAAAAVRKSESGWCSVQ